MASRAEGYVFLMRFCLVMVITGFLLLVLYNWKTGFHLMTTFSVFFITLEGMSRPPENNIINYKSWSKKCGGKRYPTLLCLGDSLTHGAVSADFTSEIPIQLASVLGLEIPRCGKIFKDPLWVVNAGNNGFTSYTLLHKELSQAMNVCPDYVVLLIGTNDVLYCLGIHEELIRVINDTMPIGEPHLEALGRNIREMIKFIREQSPKVELGICTLPPIGEDLTSSYNSRIQEANAIIEKVILEEKDERTSVIPLYAGLEIILEKNKRSSYIRPDNALVGLWMYPIYYIFRIFHIEWNILSSFIGNVVLTEGLHLNETGRDVLVTLIVDWLKSRNVAKAIAIKSM